MRIEVKVKTRARKQGLEKIDAAHYKVSVQEAPVDGKANLAVIRALSDYFNVSRSHIRIVSGQTFKNKIFDILP